MLLKQACGSAQTKTLPSLSTKQMWKASQTDPRPPSSSLLDRGSLVRLLILNVLNILTAVILGQTFLV